MALFRYFKRDGCGFNANRAPRNFFHEIAKITTFTKILPLEKYPLYGIHGFRTVEC